MAKWIFDWAKTIFWCRVRRERPRCQYGEHTSWPMSGMSFKPGQLMTSGVNITNFSWNQKIKIGLKIPCFYDEFIFRRKTSSSLQVVLFLLLMKVTYPLFLSDLRSYFFRKPGVSSYLVFSKVLSKKVSSSEPDFKLPVRRNLKF